MQLAREFLSTNAATGKILDIFKPTGTVTITLRCYQSQAHSIKRTHLQAPLLAVGETITGGTSGYTATYRGGDATGAFLQFASAGTGVTTMAFSRTTGLADESVYVTLGSATDDTSEVVTIDASGINTTTNAVTVTRAALGSTARTVPAGLSSNAWSASATVTTINEGATYTAGDTALTVPAHRFRFGSTVIIDNELCTIDQVNGNDLTPGFVEVMALPTLIIMMVLTLLFWLTTAHILLTISSEGETVTGGTSNASAILSFLTNTNAVIENKYVTTLTNGGTDHVFNNQVSQHRPYI